MIRTSIFLLALGALTGCAYTEEEFSEDYSTAFCARMATCEADIVAGYQDLGLDEATAQQTYDDAYVLTCETDHSGHDTGSTGEDTCEFNAEKAAECVTEVEDISCDFWTTGAGFPAACGAICD